MKILFGALLVLIGARIAGANGYHVGPVMFLLSWFMLAAFFPKYIATPFHHAQKHGRRLIKFVIHKRARMPLVGGVVYFTIPMALPIFVLVWIISNSRKGPKPCHEQEFQIALS